MKKFLIISAFLLLAGCSNVHYFVTDKTYGDTIDGYPIVGIVRLDTGQIFYEYKIGKEIWTQDQNYEKQ